jgi:hypothetical protein
MIPSIVIGLAILLVYLILPATIYGTLWIIVIAMITKYMALGSRITTPGVAQVHVSLEEAAEVSGGGIRHIWLRVLLPLLRNVLGNGYLVVFLVAVQNLTLPLLLTSPGNDVLATLIWNRYDLGFVQSAAALSIGGTWVSGDRSADATLAARLAADGIAVMAVDFRMPPAARYPDPVADINAAIRWLKQHHQQARTRPESVGGLGFSSGGHQIVLNALRPDDSRYRAERIEDDQGYDARLAFVVSCWGVLDPLGRYRASSARNPTRPPRETPRH